MPAIQYIAFWVLLLLPILVLAQDTEESEKKIELSGFGELDHISYFSREDGKINNRNQAILQTQLKAKISANSSLYTTLEIRNDLSDARRNRVFLDESYIDISTKRFDFRLGRQIVNWGEADGLNPTNHFNAVDLSDLLDFEREELSIYGIRTKYYYKDVKFDFVFSPVFVPALLPADSSSRWLPSLPDQVPNPFEPPPATINAQYRFEQANPLQNYNFAEDWQLGIRSSFQWPWLDASVSYYKGWNDVPKFSQAINVLNPNLLEISFIPRHYQWQFIGMDFSTATGKFGWRGESALIISDTPREGDVEKDPVFYHYVVGVDRSFANIIGDNNLFVILQWSHKIIFEGGSFPADDLNHIFQRSLLLRLEQDLGAYAKFHLQAVYDVLYGGLYFQPKLRYAIRDGLNLEALADILGGKSGSFFHQYRNNDRLQIRLEYSF
ncbi:MAG: DUF1302 family protein [Bacteroidota bacterium]